MGDISNLRVWMRMAELIEPMNNDIYSYNSNIAEIIKTPYTTYMAKELTL
jgi:hypothetical protein